MLVLETSESCTKSSPGIKNSCLAEVANFLSAEVQEIAQANLRSGKLTSSFDPPGHSPRPSRVQDCDGHRRQEAPP